MTKSFNREDRQWFVKLKKDICVFVPNAFRFSSAVTSQVPTSWYAGFYGIPEDMIAQANLWALTCTAKALIGSSTTNSYQLLDWLFISQT